MCFLAGNLWSKWLWQDGVVISDHAVMCASSELQRNPIFWTRGESKINTQGLSFSNLLCIHVSFVSFIGYDQIGMVYIDLDCRFNVLRFITLLEHRIAEIVKQTELVLQVPTDPTAPTDEQSDNKQSDLPQTVTGDFLKKFMGSDDCAALIRSVCERIYIVNCHSPVELLVAVRQVMVVMKSSQSI